MFRRSALASALAACFFAPMGQGANHPLSALTHDAAAGQSRVEFVANVDWDFDSEAPGPFSGLHPTRPGETAQITLDRAYLDGAFQQMARSLYIMTDGRHRVEKIIVYKNSLYGSNVDIRIRKGCGRSNASLGGWGNTGERTQNYALWGECDPAKGAMIVETADSLGQVLAHEQGHYLYALYDEYVEAGAPVDPQRPGFPAESDVARNSIMNNQYLFPFFSRPVDYMSGDYDRTAHGRVYRVSAWETLTRPVEQDPASARGNGRQFFEAFRGVDANIPRFAGAAPDLVNAPPADWRAPEILYVSQPRETDVLLINLAQPASALAAGIDAAQQFVRSLPVGSRVQLLSYDASGVVSERAPLQVLDENVRGAMVAQLGSLAAGEASEATGAALENVLNRLRSVDRNPGDTLYLRLYTSGDAAVATAVVEAYRQLRVGVSVNALRVAEAAGEGQTAGRASLGALARGTGGDFVSSANPAALTTAARKQASATAQTEIVATRQHSFDPLRVGERQSLSFSLGAHEEEAVILLAFDEGDMERAEIELRAPDGSVLRWSAKEPTPLSEGRLAELLEVEVDPESEALLVGIPADQDGWRGAWTLGLGATGEAMRASPELAVLAESALILESELMGVDEGEPFHPVLRASLTKDKAVTGASVEARITAWSGWDEVRAEYRVPLADSGMPAHCDALPNDGIYSACLDAYVQAKGDYDIRIFAHAADGQARLRDGGVFARPGDDEGVPMAGFSREVDEVLEFPEAEPDNPTPASGGGGGLGVLNLALLLPLMARVRRRSVASVS